MNRDANIIEQLASRFNVKAALADGCWLIAGFIYMHPHGHEEISAEGGRPGDYFVSYETVIRGIRYRADGSGEPDMADIIDVGWFSFSDALTEVFKLIIASEIDNAIVNAQFTEEEQT